MTKKDTEVKETEDEKTEALEVDGDGDVEGLKGSDAESGTGADDEISPSPVRRSKRQRKPVTPSQASAPSSPKKKRQRRITHKMEEMLQQQDQKKFEKELAKMKPKRKYRKRQKKAGNNNDNDGDGDGDTSNANVGEKKKQSQVTAESDDQESSLDEKDMVCCICHCTVDFSERELFEWSGQDDHEVVVTTSDSEQDGFGNKEGATKSKDGDRPENIQNHKGDDSFSENIRGEKRGENDGTGSGEDNSREQAKDTDENGRNDKDGVGDGNGNGENASEESDPGNYYGIKLPSTLYDRNNALLICDGEGCNRCFHQRCHFVPVLCVPKREWYCLICQMKNKLKNTKKKRGRKRKTSTAAATTTTMSANVGTDLSNVTDGDEIQISQTPPLTVEELDVIYRISVSQDGDNKNVGNNKASFSPRQILMAQRRFEYHSAELKSELIHKELSKRIKSTIDHNLSSIRLCQNSIRALTETKRARKSIIDNYSITKRLPQTLIQNFHKFSHCKLRLRDLMLSLQCVIQNKNDSEMVRDWFETLRLRYRKEGSLPLPAAGITITNGSSHDSVSDRDKVRTAQTAKDPPVPDMISLESSPANTECSIIRSGGDLNLDLSILEKKLFVGKPTRKEARFDIKDYDADEDDSNDEESDDPTNKVFCFVCSSGHVDDENDVVMCDGKDCFRALHMKCRTPKVTQQMLDEDANGTFFCPYCTCFATALHYTETEFYADVRGLDVEDEDDNNPNDDSSTKSWERADEVFPESVEEFAVAEHWKEGKRDDRSDRILYDSLGIDVTCENGAVDTINDHNANDGQDENDDDDDDDESDTDFSSKSMEQSCASSNSDSDDSSGLDWGINKAEVSALSCSDSDSDSDSDSQGEDGQRVRRSRRLGKEKEVKPAKTLDGGALDTTNIVRGKRRRTAVDYRRLNDAMFGEGGEMIPTKDIDDEEEYQFTMKTVKSHDSSDEDSESGDEDDDTSKTNANGSSDSEGSGTGTSNTSQANTSDGSKPHAKNRQKKKNAPGAKNVEEKDAKKSVKN